MVKIFSWEDSYCEDVLCYIDVLMCWCFEVMGFFVVIYFNLVLDCVFFLVVKWIEDVVLLIFFCYGYGDMVLGEEGCWDENCDFWVLDIV